MKRWQLWRNWIFANAVGELVGLGAAALVMLAFSRSVPRNELGLISAAALIIVFGAFEGAVVGYTQWRVLRQIATIREFDWIAATTIGAAVAWLLGLLPSTIVNMPPAEKPGVPAMFLLSVGVGVVSGLILASAQTWVLQAFSRRAGWWLVANALAWAAGMPIVFFSAALPAAQTPLSFVIGLLLTTVFVTGAVVGAIHGAFLPLIFGRRKEVEFDAQLSKALGSPVTAGP